jgi:hypothetical protein
MYNAIAPHNRLPENLRQANKLHDAIEQVKQYFCIDLVVSYLY